MKYTTFQLEVTPPVGTPMAYSVCQGVDFPIFIRGVLLDDGINRAALVACDYIYIWGQAWLDWRRHIAAAAHMEEERVLLHCLHQHDSMRITASSDIQEAVGFLASDMGYAEGTIARLETTVREAAAAEWRVAAKLMVAERRMSGLAANRRIIEKGRCVATRFSMCDDPLLRARPVGKIDPLLRTIALADRNGKPLVALHFYATHPMTAYHRGLVSADMPGAALAYAENALNDEIFHMYLTGCSGDVTLGKYFLGDKEESLRVLGRRMGEGLVSNIQRLEERPLGAISFACAKFLFPFDWKENDTGLLREARRLLAQEREKWENASLYRLSLGEGVHILSFPSEAVVEYQIHAQSLAPEALVACASHGNSTYFYLPTATMFEEGGYEPTASLATPQIEERLKKALAELLHDPPN